MRRNGKILRMDIGEFLAASWTRVGEKWYRIDPSNGSSQVENEAFFVHFDSGSSTVIVTCC
jgi:hypothetical protein